MNPAFSAHFALFIISAFQLLTSPCSAADDLSEFYTSLRKVFTQHYPGATVATKDKSVTFDHNTRLFMIHEGLKTGEWQNAKEQRGPKKGGIFCEIFAGNGVYRGAAEIPQTFDKHYFSVMLLAPYSKRLDTHLHVRLSYPADVSKEFLQEFTKTVNKFHDY